MMKVKVPIKSINGVPSIESMNIFSLTYGDTSGEQRYTVILEIRDIQYEIDLDKIYEALEYESGTG
jgi:hypothetical protein